MLDLGGGVRGHGHGYEHGLKECVVVSVHLMSSIELHSPREFWWSQFIPPPTLHHKLKSFQPAYHHKATGDARFEKVANMTDSIAEALEQLHLAEESANDDAIDDILERTAPPRQRKPDLDELKRRLEQKYLTPSQTFSTEWLNRLQQ